MAWDGLSSPSGDSSKAQVGSWAGSGSYTLIPPGLPRQHVGFGEGQHRRLEHSGYACTINTHVPSKTKP
jgi:hypothetical protein